MSTAPENQKSTKNRSRRSFRYFSFSDVTRKVVGGILFAVVLSGGAIGIGRGEPSKPVGVLAPVAKPSKIDYGRDVQPILSNYCYACHGPDTASREAGLRLDLKEMALAFKNKEGRFAIVPGNPEQSELVNRVESHDPEVMMPQDKDKLLNPEQIALLREWITQGAEFRDHWAFENPVKAPLPVVKDTSRVHGPIDNFVLSKLESANLHFQPEADKSLLLRRVTLDLTGLLPTPAELAAFVADPAPDAYEKVVNRLLASPRYGEHRARYWLDYSRYGDTSGLHNDVSQFRWPFRDYVIKSFNADKPFDQFTLEQLAGDLLPAKNVDALVASGLMRNGISTGEGGTFLEELRVNNARERTEAFGALYMGMSTGCAACHDHKYDPLTQREMYQLTAFFNNIDELPNNFDRHNWQPSITLPKPENEAEYNTVFAQKTALEQQVRDRRKNLEPLLAAWQANGG